MGCVFRSGHMMLQIPLLKVFKPVPKSTYSGPAEREAVEKMRSISKQKAEVSKFLKCSVQLKVMYIRICMYVGVS